MPRKNGKRLGKKKLLKGLVLPTDVLGIVAKELIANGCYGTCAALNVTSQAIYHETLQTLWRTVIGWGVKALAKVPANSWGLFDEACGGTELERSKQEVYESWNVFINARGAKYIEYLVVPSLQSTSGGSDPLSMITQGKLGIEAPSLPRLKAVIDVVHYIAYGYSGTIEGGRIFLTSLYVHGTLDLVNLSVALGMFYSAGNKLVKQLLNIGVSLFPHHIPQTISDPVKNRWKYSIDVNRLLRPGKNGFRPVKTMILYDGGAPDNIHALVDTFLDVTYWMSRWEEGSGAQCGHNVGLVGVDEKQMTMCAKAVQKAIILDPSMAFTNWAFESADLPLTRSVIDGVEKIVAVIRGTHIRAAKKVNKFRVGGSHIMWKTTPADVDVVWSVGTPPTSTHLATTMIRMPLTGPPTVLHRDPW